MNKPTPFGGFPIDEPPYLSITELPMWDDPGRPQSISIGFQALTLVLTLSETGAPPNKNHGESWFFPLFQTAMQFYTYVGVCIDIIDGNIWGSYIPILLS